jgi:entry exclusion lipoprotein TrbK
VALSHRSLAGAALATVALAACGSKPAPTPEEQVRATLSQLADATAKKDYKALCTRILAPDLVEQVTAIGLPCEVALRRGLEGVNQPRLRVGRVRVTKKDRASAEVSTSAAGQEPSRDVVELVKVKAGWRVSSLAGQGPPSPTPAPDEP